MNKEQKKAAQAAVINQVLNYIRGSARTIRLTPPERDLLKDLQKELEG